MEKSEGEEGTREVVSHCHGSAYSGLHPRQSPHGAPGQAGQLPRRIFVKSRLAYAFRVFKELFAAPPCLELRAAFAFLNAIGGKHTPWHNYGLKLVGISGLISLYFAASQCDVAFL